MAKFDAVCLSGVINADVETYKKQGLLVARFFIHINSASDGDPAATSRGSLW